MKNSLCIFLLILHTFSQLNPIQCDKILVLLPLASKSHKNVFEPLIQALADGGHKLIVVSPYAPQTTRTNIEEIVPLKTPLFSDLGDPFKLREDSKWGMLWINLQFIFDGCHEVYQNQAFLSLLHQKFDLILIDSFMNDCLHGFTYKLKAPVISVCPQAAPNSVTQQVGNRLPPSFIPSSFLPFDDEMTFYERLINVGYLMVAEVFGRFAYVRKNEEIYRKYLGEDLPGMSEIASNISMIFMNSHFTLTFPRPLLPDIIEVGGMHCRLPKPLPKEMQYFVSGAEHGFIYFSLGSIIQGTQMPEHMRQVFLNVFSRLKQRVLWKWETEEMPRLPRNVKLSKWLPQQDILGHPNIKMFLTHGGLLSTQEATFHGVPLVGFPIFGDQDLNIKQASRAGYAVMVEILELTEEKLENAINLILNNETYTLRAKELSRMYRDQTETPLERAVFWTEYVLRHKGALQLRSASRKLNFFQYHSLDVLGFLAFVTLMILWVVKKLLTTICMRLLPGRSKSTEKTE